MSMSDDDLELIAAGFTAILGFQVVPPNRGQGLPKLTVHELFHCTYIPRSLANVAAGEVFDVHVKTITGATTTVQVTETHTIAEIKAEMEIKENIPARDQRLMFNGYAVEDDNTVLELGIPSGGTVYLLVRSRTGAGPHYQLDTNDLDPPYNYDFTNVRDDGKEYVRGGKVYKRPYGWKRYAVKVLGTYENNTWLGPDGIRTQDTQGEWPVSYHGTNLQSAKAIMDTGYGPRGPYGKAVYSSPSLEIVEKYYAHEFKHKGVDWKLALQNRINPDPAHFELISAEQTGVGAEYWLSPKQDKDKGVFDLRPYGLLFKKLK